MPTTEKSIQEQLDEARAQNAKLQEKLNQKRTISMKVSEKKALSFYGLGRWPVTLYKEQWVRLLNEVEAIKQFLIDHDAELVDKE